MERICIWTIIIRVTDIIVYQLETIITWIRINRIWWIPYCILRNTYRVHKNFPCHLMQCIGSGMCCVSPKRYQCTITPSPTTYTNHVAHMRTKQRLYVYSVFGGSFAFNKTINKVIQHISRWITRKLPKDLFFLYKTKYLGMEKIISYKTCLQESITIITTTTKLGTKISSRNYN